jgi:hypothetical protein
MSMLLLLVIPALLYGIGWFSKNYAHRKPGWIDFPPPAPTQSARPTPPPTET